LATRFLAGRPFALADERVLNFGWAMVRDANCAISVSTPDTFGALASHMGEAGAAADQLEERGRLGQRMRQLVDTGRVQVAPASRSVQI